MSKSNFLCCDSSLLFVEIVFKRNLAWQICPMFLFNLDEEWTDWSPWGACTSSCGGGLRLRTRKCNTTLDTISEMLCVGNSEESNVCGVLECRGTKANECISTLTEGYFE